MEFRILGPLEVLDDDGAIALRGAKPRALMAVLLLNANEPVSSERLAVALWGEEAPASAAKTVQVHVSRLRKSLGDSDILTTTPAGYRLRVLPGELDAERFAQLVEEGRRELRSGHPERASAALRDGLALWRGPPLADLEFEAFAQPEISRLEEQRLVALEARADAELAAGRHVALVGELQRLARLYPSRERFAGQLMLALYRSDRQTEALAAYRDARQALVETSGIEPGPELRRLHEAILRQDPALRLPPSSELPPELDASRAPALAGREDEVADLLDRWERARGGHGTVVTISGEHGIGKTRLAMELAGEVHRLGALVLYASGLGAADGVDWVIAQAREAASPLLLVLDDLDRAGPAVHAELRGLAAGVGALPVMVLAAGSDVERAAPEGAFRLALGPLGLDAVATIAASYARDQPDEDVPVEWLFERSGGTPLRIHEAASEWASHEAERRIGAVAGRAAEGRVQLRSMEAELAGGIVDLQAVRERAASIARPETQVVCPFKGLAAFDTDDAEYYFGRERLVAELVARIVGAPLLGIVGPSGSGKSSVLRAGLLPALAAGVLPGSETWEQVIIRPGEHPLWELNRAGAAVSDQSRLVLAVDQFEETFTACDDDVERDAFVGSLVHAARDTRGRCVVVLAIRADQYERCAAYPALSGLLAANHVLVTPMQREELRDVVERPAQRVGLVVEPGLTDALVADVEGEPGALPLLSTALLELWQQRDGRRLHRAAYERSGGVRGAVGRLAEEAYAHLDPRQQEIARSALVRLAAEGAGGTVERRRVPLAELETEQSEEAAGLIELFMDRRLLTVTSGSVEVTHEALLREWPRLRGWIEEDREGLRIHRGVTAAADEWQRLDRDDGALFRGSRLAEASEWRDTRAPTLNELEREFLDVSKGRRDRERAARRRWIEVAFAGLAVALAAITAVAIVAISQGREAGRQRDAAAAGELAAKATGLLEADPRLSLALGLRALDRSDSPQAENAVRQATFSARGTGIREAADGPVYAATPSADGQLVVTGGQDGAVRIWSLESSRPLATINDPGGSVFGAALSPDGERVAVADQAGVVALYDADGSHRRVLVHKSPNYGNSVRFSHDGSRIVVPFLDGTVRVIPVDGSPITVLRGHTDLAYSATFDQSGRHVVSSSFDGTARIWDVARRSSVVLDQHGRGFGADFSPDGRRVVTAGEDGRARIWPTSGRGRPTSFRADDQALAAVHFDSDGRRVVTTGEDGVIRLWDTAGGPPLAELIGHRGAAFQAEFVTGSNTIVSSGDDGTLRIWEPPTVSMFHAPVNSVAFSGDGKSVVSGGRDGVVRVWETATGSVRKLDGGAMANVAEFSPDGTQVVAASTDGTVRIWRLSSGSPRVIDEPRFVKFSATFDPSGTRIAFAGADPRVFVERADGGERGVYRMPRGRVYDVAFSPDGRHLAAAGDRSVRIWNVSTRQTERVLRGHQEAVSSVAYDRAGTHLVTAGADGTARVWDLDDGGSEVMRGHEGPVLSAAFNPAGDRVATAGQDGSVRIWPASGGETLVVLFTHTGSALGATFSPDGTQVASAGQDAIIRFTQCEVCGSLTKVLQLAHTRADIKLSESERQRFLAGG